MLDVDKELWEVLDLCSDEELETIYDVLFGASPFSPVVKSMVKEDEPPLLQLRGRTSIMHKVCPAKRLLAHVCCSCACMPAAAWAMCAPAVKPRLLPWLFLSCTRLQLHQDAECVAAAG
jgi:hypothetical protein